MVLLFLIVLSLLSIIIFLQWGIYSRHDLLHCIRQLMSDCLQEYQYFTIPRYHSNSQENLLFCKVADYIASLSNLEESDTASIFSGGCSTNEFYLQPGPGETVHDSFLGAQVTWTKPSDGHDRFVLRIKSEDRVRILRPYILHVKSEASKDKSNYREPCLFTHTSNNGETRWISVPFAHPATFDTLVIDPVLKKRVYSDLESFTKNRSNYHRLGRVWNRSYLIYGWPGTGKSSLAVAMAKALRFDIRIIDMARCSIDILERLLLHTRPRSLILLENLDLYLNKNSAPGNTSINSIMNRVKSYCGDERVMVFTMTGGEDLVNHTVVPLFRFDVNIYLPMCDFNAFKVLAERYLAVKEHDLFQVIEEEFESGMQISHASVGEIMLANRQSTTRTVELILEAMKPPMANNASSSSNGSVCIGKGGDGNGADKQAIIANGRASKDKIVNLTTKICRLSNVGGLKKMLKE
ncbi:P-loop containing nucleoside triphosphate hydrolases superfamily protein [Rhynchospora pubera]|uniref:P-loop containing nucleoside triphosphate hydrolases superfamily protein n=1 Tax=Rhynchospora pubera TaxID=906938 RepID=A0AAV8E9M0_9POAL|nr:P-loop containing nucleoside triphosphate hydrolases superfamily protein [Rhynchospora pubera]